MSGWITLSLAAVLFLAALTVSGERKKADAARFFRLNAVVGTAGGGILLLSAAAFPLLLYTGGADDDYRDWFFSLFGWYLLFTSLLGGLILLLLFSALPVVRANPKQKKGLHRFLRLSLNLAGSVALLLAAVLPLPFADNERALLPVALYFFGFGWAHLLRLAALPEYR